MQLILAIYFMFRAHFFQKDKGGKWYIFHPIHVSMNVSGYKEKIVALLHDVVEDSNYTFSDLERYFNKDVMDALKLITKDKNIDYFDYLSNIKNNEISRKVKLEDLRHNIQEKRLKVITEKDILRINKYKEAINFLKK